MKTLIALSALASLMLCAACTEKSAPSASLGSPQQFGAIQWDEMAAAQQTAHVSNDKLIFMR